MPAKNQKNFSKCLFILKQTHKRTYTMTFKHTVAHTHSHTHATYAHTLRLRLPTFCRQFATFLRLDDIFIHCPFAIVIVWHRCYCCCCLSKWFHISARLELCNICWLPASRRLFGPTFPPLSVCVLVCLCACVTKPTATVSQTVLGMHI